MGKLTNDIFNESCCDGGASSGKESASPCGCDPGANWVCNVHANTARIAIRVFDALGVQTLADALTEIERLQYWESKGGL